MQRFFFRHFHPVTIGFLFISNDHGTQQAATQEISHGIKRKIREQKLKDHKKRHCDPEQRDGAIPLFLHHPLPQKRSKCMDRGQEKQDDLRSKDHITERFWQINTVLRNGKQHRDKDIQNGTGCNKNRDHTTGDDQKAPKKACLFQIDDHKLRPEKNTKRHRQKIKGSVYKQPHRKFRTFEGPPKNIGHIIKEHCIQKPAVSFPGRSVKCTAPVCKNILVFDQQDQYPENSYGRIIHDDVLLSK